MYISYCNLYMVHIPILKIRLIRYEYTSPILKIRLIRCEYTSPYWRSGWSGMNTHPHTEDQADQVWIHIPILKIRPLARIFSKRSRGYAWLQWRISELSINWVVINTLSLLYNKQTWNIYVTTSDNHVPQLSW
jgi:hypothetical protein